MTHYVEQKQKPVLPLYAAGAVWLVGGLIFPLYRLWALALTALLSVGAYFALARLCPTRVVRKEVAYSTGDSSADAVLAQIEELLDQLHKVNERITEPELSARMDRMEKAGRAIAAEVAHTPAKAKTVRRFASYYLPDSVKILETYARLIEGGVKGENAASIRDEVYKNTETIAAAFENQLDALYSSEAMDISTDIEVLEGILKGQGLSQ